MVRMATTFSPPLRVRSISALTAPLVTFVMVPASTLRAPIHTKALPRRAITSKGSDALPWRQSEHRSATSKSQDDAELLPPGASSKSLGPASQGVRPTRSPHTVDSGPGLDTWRCDTGEGTLSVLCG